MSLSDLTGRYSVVQRIFGMSCYGDDVEPAASKRVGSPLITANRIQQFPFAVMIWVQLYRRLVLLKGGSCNILQQLLTLSVKTCVIPTGGVCEPWVSKWPFVWQGLFGWKIVPQISALFR